MLFSGPRFSITGFIACVCYHHWCRTPRRQLGGHQAGRGRLPSIFHRPGDLTVRPEVGFCVPTLGDTIEVTQKGTGMDQLEQMLTVNSGYLMQTWPESWSSLVVRNSLIGLLVLQPHRPSRRPICTVTPQVRWVVRRCSARCLLNVTCSRSHSLSWGL